MTYIPISRHAERDRVLRRAHQDAAFRTYEDNIAAARALDPFLAMSDRAANAICDLVQLDAELRGYAR